jgi:hypothetical protein
MNRTHVGPPARITCRYPTPTLSVPAPDCSQLLKFGNQKIVSGVVSYEVQEQMVVRDLFEHGGGPAGLLQLVILGPDVGAVRPGARQKTVRVVVRDEDDPQCSLKARDGRCRLGRLPDVIQASPVDPVGRNSMKQIAAAVIRDKDHVKLIPVKTDCRGKWAGLIDSDVRHVFSFSMRR